MKLESGTYDNVTATDSVVTNGWIVFEICCKHDKQLFKFLLPLFFGRASNCPPRRVSDAL